MTMIDCETEKPGGFRHTLRLRNHTFHTDLETSGGGEDSAPGPHDYFDAALASCKALTAMWYAKKHGMPLERVETHVESDASEERNGKYVLRVRLAFHGPLSDEDKKRIHAAVAKCPVHKLMTSVDVVIETAPLLP